MHLALILYVPIKLYSYLKFEKMVHLPGAYILKSCTRRPKYARRRQHARCTLKPIFHCNTKALALGVRIGQYPQRENFAFGMLVSKNAQICIAPNANAKICVTPNANPQREQMEYRSCWVPRGAGIGHVDFMLFVSILVALGTQRKRQWNSGFNFEH